MIRYDFAGKVALVTGSSRGIGAAILRQFLDAGATGILHDFDDPNGINLKAAEVLAADFPGRVKVLTADVRDAAAIEAMMASVKAEFGGLDILVNNAGILKDRTIRKMSLDDWHSVDSTNLTGVFHC